MKFLSNIKKILSGILIASSFSALISFGPVKAEAVSFKDLDKGAEYARASITALANSNIISGDNGYFHPLATVKRSEMIKMIVNVLHLDITNLPDKATFKDVPESHWAYPYVEAAYKAGITDGISANVFGVDRNCTREEMASMYVRALGLKDNDLKGRQPFIYVNRMTDKNTISAWAKDNVEFALSTGIMQGAGTTFGAKMPAQRQQAAVVTVRYLNGTEAINEFADKFKNEAEYLELYNALQASGQMFNGNIEMALETDSKDDSGNSISKMSMGMTGSIVADTTGKAADFDIDYNVGVNAMGTSINSKFRIIKLADKYYVKYQDTDNWDIMSSEEMQQLGASPADMGGDAQMLLRFYRYASISKEAVSDFKGTAAVKYTMTFKPDALEAMMSAASEGQSADEDGIQPADLKNVTGNIVVYLNDKNQLIGENVEFTGVMWDETAESNITVSTNLSAYFASAKTPVVIIAPVSVKS